MAHFGTAVLIDRAVKLLQQELATELTAVDTAANARAVAATSEYSFTTTCPASTAIRGYFDAALDADQSVTVLEADVGRVYEERLQQLAMEGSPSNRPRFHVMHGLIVRTRVRSRRDSWGHDGAYRRCDRISTAAVVLLGRYNKLSVPAPASLSTICHEPVKVIADRRPSHVEEQDGLMVARDVALLLSTLEDR